MDIQSSKGEREGLYIDCSRTALAGKLQSLVWDVGMRYALLGGEANGIYRITHLTNCQSIGCYNLCCLAAGSSV